MKTKTQKIFEIIGIICIGLLICNGLFKFVDYISNGFILEWLDSQFVYSYKMTNDYGNTVVVQDINWTLMKQYALSILMLITFFWLVVVILVKIYERRKIKAQTVNDIEKKIQKYMNKDCDPNEVFDAEYASIGAAMSTIKTNMLKSEQALIQESNRKNDLITYLAHDLKTPLTSVIGYLNLLDEASDMPLEQKAKYIHISFEKALRLEQLINEFFDITRFNLNQIHLNKENIDLSYMLIQMADEFYPILANHNNTIEMQVDENLYIEADAMNLARVFNNIIKNAISYSSQNTAIHIQATQDEKQTVISFQNIGKTIPPAKLNSIFEKFFRLDDARQTNSGGAGLGLAIAKEIVELHHGSIEATSQDGKTTFTVRLPNQQYS